MGIEQERHLPVVGEVVQRCLEVGRNAVGRGGELRPSGGVIACRACNVIAYYERYDEQGRLARGTGALELARMQELIKRFLAPPPRVVLDVGGGPPSSPSAPVDHSRTAR